MTVEFASKILVAILAARNTQEAVDVVERYGSLGVRRVVSNYQDGSDLLTKFETNLLDAITGIIDSMVAGDFSDFVSKQIGSKVVLDDLSYENLNLKISLSWPEPQAIITVQTHIISGDDVKTTGSLEAIYGRTVSRTERGGAKFSPRIIDEEMSIDFGEERHVGTKAITSIARLMRGDHERKCV